MVQAGTDLARARCASNAHVWRSQWSVEPFAINSENRHPASSTSPPGIGMNLAEKRAGAGESGLE
jgi:hypothetical protein